ncbi:MAG: roadblock/LC7 domain-containing protein, partial [Candidatus Heimdallarchaeaceae archaeon]
RKSKMSISLPPEKKKELIKILKQISQGCELEALAVVTDEGIKVAFFAEKSADPDLLSAVSSAVLSTGEMVTKQLSHGFLEQVLIRGAKGFTILSNLDHYLLIGASKDLHSVGLAIQVIRRHSPTIAELLN